MNIDQKIAKVLLLPLSLLFGIGVSIKDLLYKAGFLRGVKYNLPIINVGNLTVGGAGKTPHIEYLIRLLSPYLQISALSRGYKRKTSGFLMVNRSHNSDDVGDEPLMYARKYPGVVVAVSENRAMGVPMLLQNYPQLQAILLDDAYQHQAITPNLNILLTEYSDPFYNDWLLPAGRLREWRSAYKRADLIIVTKCPTELTVEEREKMTRAIRPLPAQSVFFSRYRYHNPYPMYRNFNEEGYGGVITLGEEYSVLLVCGIARTNYLLDYVEAHAGYVSILQYEDHHAYTRYDMEILAKHFTHMPGDNKIVLTTEKDAMRLERQAHLIREYGLPIYLLPIEVVFFDGQDRFDDTVKQFLMDFKV